jgi:hypothetical protein
MCMRSKHLFDSGRVEAYATELILVGLVAFFVISSPGGGMTPQEFILGESRVLRMYDEKIQDFLGGNI